MAHSRKSKTPRMLTNIAQWLLLGLSGAIAALLVMQLFSFSIVLYLAVTAGRTPQAYEVWGLVGLTSILGLLLAFILILRRIVMSVQESPFSPQNAQRLQRMAWIALAWQALVVAFALANHQINIINSGGILVSIVDARSYSASGAILVLALFILSHVFRTGSAMRDDLEGTV